VDDGITPTECDFGVLVSKSEIEPFRRRENGQNSNLDVNIECGGEALGLTGTEMKLLPTLGTGQGLWRIRNRSFVVQAQLHPDEARLFETGIRASGR